MTEIIQKEDKFLIDNINASGFIDSAVDWVVKL
jgi:Ca2+-binding EF-hand superfamily protein